MGSALHRLKHFLAERGGRIGNLDARGTQGFDLARTLSATIAVETFDQLARDTGTLIGRKRKSFFQNPRCPRHVDPKRSAGALRKCVAAPVGEDYASLNANERQPSFFEGVRPPAERCVAAYCV